MQTHKILILASFENTSSKLIIKELSSRSHLTSQASFFSDLEFTFEGSKVEITISGKSVSDFDLVYMFNIWDVNKEIFNILMSYLVKKQVKFVDPILAGGNYYDICKLSQTYKRISAGLLCPRTYVGNKLSSATKFFNLREPFKLVAKDSSLDHGEGVFLITSFPELENCLKKGYLIQEYFAKKIDLRVIVVGGTALGCVRRTPIAGEFRSNVGHDAIAEVYPLSPELADLAVKATFAMGFDIAGVDILIDQNDQKYILEVNRSPQYAYDADPFFLNFVKLTGINVTAKIADFLELKLATKGESFRG